jgi:hypothetical protein
VVNHEMSHDSLSSGRDLNQRPPEYEAWYLTARKLREVVPHINFRMCYTFSDKAPDLFVHAARRFRRFIQYLKKKR